MPLADDISLVHREHRGGLQISAMRGDQTIGLIRAVRTEETLNLFEVFVLPAARGQHVAKALYRALVATALREGRRLVSAQQRTQSAESLCRLLEQRGRARPEGETGRGQVVFAKDGLAAAPGLVEPELDPRGQPYWPVGRWLLDPDTTDVAQLDQSSPV